MIENPFMTGSPDVDRVVFLDSMDTRPVELDGFFPPSLIVISSGFLAMLSPP